MFPGLLPPACVSGIFILPSDTYHGDLSISPLHSLGRYLENIEMGNSGYSSATIVSSTYLLRTMLVLSWFTGRWLLLRIWSIWKHVRSAFRTPQRPVDPAPSVAATSNQNTNIISPSMMVEETQRPTGSDLSDNGRSVLEATPGCWTAVRPEVSSTSSEAGSQSDPLDDEESDLGSDDGFNLKYYSGEYRRQWVCQSAKRQRRNLIVFPGHHSSQSHPFRGH